MHRPQTPDLPHKPDMDRDIRPTYIQSHVYLTLSNLSHFQTLGPT